MISYTNVTANLGANSGNNLLGGKVSLGTADQPLTDWISTKGSSSAAIVAQSIGGGGGFAASSNTTTSDATISATGGITTSSALGALAGTGNHASAVEIYSNASISTQGNNAPGMVAQSIGSGGGLVTFNNVFTQITSLSETYNLGAHSGATGSGADVTATLAGQSIATTGANSIGFVAQSIGGGGGLVLANSASITASNQTASQNIVIGGSGAGQSDGGVVNVTVSNTINTGSTDKPASGPNSIAIATQSIGGGGGMVNSTLSTGYLSLYNIRIGGQSDSLAGNSANITVTQNGAITTQGPAAIGILAQSIGGGGGYLALASTQGNTLVVNSNVNIGGVGSNSGNGGNVKVDVNAPITTYGNNSIGVIAQSVGGGGGILLTSGLKDLITPTFTAGVGSGGSVTVNVNKPIIMNGAGVFGVIAQSIGGGGGMAISETGVKDGSGKGGGEGGAVAVNVNSSIYVNGKTTQSNTGNSLAITNNSDSSAYGVYAKSIGTSDPSITVAKGAVVYASGGATAISLDGLVNNIINNGYIGVQNLKTDTAISISGTGGTTTIFNNGVLSGNIVNSGSNISLNNLAGARLYLTTAPDLGGGVLTNAGFLQFNPQGLAGLATLAHTGTLIQTSTGVLGIQYDHQAAASGQAIASSSISVGTGSHVELGGSISPTLINAGLITPGSAGPKTILQNSGGTLIADQLGVINTAIMSYNLQKSSSAVQLGSTANFAPAGLSSYASQVGSAIGQYQTAGSNALFQAATAQLVTIPTVGSLDQAYNNLAGAAIQAMPQANYQAVTRAVGTVSDRMNSWRVGDSFIATTKNPRALMTGVASMNQPITPNAPQVATGTLSADGGQSPLIASTKSSDGKTWITPFGGASNSNNLADQIYGGSIGVESESDDRRFIGGAALTLSQSNYTYSSTTTPATPGAATNYGAQFYFGARHESAYLSAIGYLGGSTGNFARQLQALGLNTSTGVNVHSNIMGARVEAGYNLLPNPEGKRTLQVTPFVAIAPTQIRQNGANEYFNGLGSGFYYGSNINTAVPIYLGAEVSGDIELGNNEVVKPFLRASWAHDLMSPNTMAAAYNPGYGPTLYSNGTPSMGNMVILKGGAKYNWGTKVSAYATIDLEQGNAAYSYRGIGGSIGAIYSW